MKEFNVGKLEQKDFLLDKLFSNSNHWLSGSHNLRNHGQWQFKLYLWRLLGNFKGWRQHRISYTLSQVILESSSLVVVLISLLTLQITGWKQRRLLWLQASLWNFLLATISFQAPVRISGTIPGTGTTMSFFMSAR